MLLANDHSCSYAIDLHMLLSTFALSCQVEHKAGVSGTDIDLQKEKTET